MFAMKMKLPFWPPGLVLTLWISKVSAGLEPGFYSGFDDDGARFSMVSKEQQKADHQMEYTMDDTLDIGIVEVRDGVYHSKSFKLQELERYFDHQKHKGIRFDFVSQGRPLKQEPGGGHGRA